MRKNVAFMRDIQGVMSKQLGLEGSRATSRKWILRAIVLKKYRVE